MKQLKPYQIDTDKIDMEKLKRQVRAELIKRNPEGYISSEVKDES